MTTYQLPASNLDTQLAVQRHGITVHYHHDDPMDRDLIPDLARNEATQRDVTVRIQSELAYTAVTFGATSGRKRGSEREALEALPVGGTYMLQRPVNQTIRNLLVKVSKETGHRYQLRNKTVTRIDVNSSRQPVDAEGDTKNKEK